MTTRLTILAGIFLAASASIGAITRTEIVPIRRTLQAFPMQLDDWHGRRLPDFEAKIVGILGVDDYLTRMYRRANSPELHLYIGYHDSQRQGDTIHSPLNCLPGAGWEPMAFARAWLEVPDGEGSPRRIEVNRVIIQKGLDRQLVYYWYQSQGRVVASEYWGRVYLVLDAIRFNRTDGAMVRVIAPLPDAQRFTEADERRAEEGATAFIRSLFPRLREFLPE